MSRLSSNDGPNGPIWCKTTTLECLSQHRWIISLAWCNYPDSPLKGTSPLDLWSWKPHDSPTVSLPKKLIQLFAELFQRIILAQCSEHLRRVLDLLRSW
jgi:hypothetical protein